MTNLKIDESTGQVTISEPLDRSSAATVTLSIQATDTSATPPQHGLATLVVTIVDVNDFEPVFPEPWTKENPYITIQVSEELPRGSIVHKFVATDPDSNIDKFRIMPKSEYFSIEPETGNLKVSLNNVQDAWTSDNKTMLAVISHMHITC